MPRRKLFESTARAVGAPANLIDGQPVRRRYVRLPDWLNATGMKRSKTLAEIKAGRLRAIRHGRTLLIDWEAGMAWLESLPSAAANPK